MYRRPMVPITLSSGDLAFLNLRVPECEDSGYQGLRRFSNSRLLQEIMVNKIHLKIKFNFFFNGNFFVLRTNAELSDLIALE